MATPEEALAELYRRGALKGAQKAAFEELMRRGAVPGLAAKQEGLRTVEQVRGSPGYQDERARADRGQKARAGFKSGALPFMDAAIPLPVGDEIAGVGGAVGAVFDNLGRMVTGRPLRSEREAYQGAADAERDRAESYRKRHPFAAGLMEVASGLGAASAPRAVVAGAPAVSRSLAARAGRGVRGVAAGAAAGAAGGAAYGFAENDGDFDQRLGAAGRGAGAGAVVGGAFSAAAPAVIAGGRAAVRGAMGLGQDATRALTRQPLRPGEVAPLSEREALQAEDELMNMLRAEGVTTPEALQARLDELANAPDAVAMDVLGRRGVQAATALARRPGRTAQRFEELNRTRQEEAPGYILESARDDLGVDPEAARAGVETIVERGQAGAREPFGRAFAAGPMSSPKLDELLTRPDIADALPAAARLARNEGLNPRELGLRDLDATPDGLAAGADGEGAAALDPLTKQALDAVRAGVAGRLRQGPSLQTWVRREFGGVSDPGGDLRAMGAGERGRADVRGRGGISADDAAGPRAAYEAGYFDKPPTPDEFREALMGPARYSNRRAVDPKQADLVARLADVEERLASVGLDARKASDAEIAAAFARQDEFEASLGDIANREPIPADELYSGPPRGASDAWEPPPAEPVARVDGAPGPAVEPTPSEEWGPRALHYVKRALDNRVANDQRASVTGRLSPEGRVTSNLAREFRDELRNLNSAYGEALDLSGEYLSLEAAYRGARGSLTRGSVGDFQAKVRKMTPGEMNGVRAALANDLLEMAEKGLLRGGRVTQPGVRRKLALAFGPDRAREFVRKAEARARLNANSARADPRSNSTTGEVLEYNREADLSKGLQVFGQAGRQFASGNVAGGLSTLTFGGLAKLMNVARTTGAPVQVRDELGRLLSLDADELAAILRRRAAEGAIEPPRSVRGLPLQSGFAAALMAGGLSQ